MRKLTLHEKITIKGILSNYFITGFPELDMEAATYFFAICTGKSISNYYKYIPKRIK